PQPGAVREAQDGWHQLPATAQAAPSAATQEGGGVAPTLVPGALQSMVRRRINRAHMPSEGPEGGRRRAMDPSHPRVPGEDAPIEEPVELAPRSRSRRSLLAGLAAAGGALASQALTRPLPAAAADVALGTVNTAAATTTIRNTQAAPTAVALKGQV